MEAPLEQFLLDSCILFSNHLTPVLLVLLFPFIYFFEPKAHCSPSSFRSVMPDFCDPMDCSPPGTSIHGILQARTPDWVAISLAHC